jgi:hypothetical protein
MASLVIASRSRFSRSRFSRFFFRARAFLLDIALEEGMVCVRVVCASWLVLCVVASEKSVTKRFRLIYFLFTQRSWNPFSRAGALRPQRAYPCIQGS